VSKRGAGDVPIQGLHSGLSLNINERFRQLDDLQIKLPITRVKKMFMKSLYYYTGRNNITVDDAAILRMTDAVILFIVRSIVRAGVIANAAARITVRTGDMQDVMLLDESRN
jgi:histone H3/H4